MSPDTPTFNMQKTPQCWKLLFKGWVNSKKRHLLDEALDFRARHQHAVLCNLAVEICISLAEFCNFKNLIAKFLPINCAGIIDLNLWYHLFLIRAIRNWVKLRLKCRKERYTLAVPKTGCLTERRLVIITGWWYTELKVTEHLWIFRWTILFVFDLLYSY